MVSNSATLKATTLNIAASLKAHQLISKKRLFEKYYSYDTNFANTNIVQAYQFSTLNDIF